MGKPIASGKSDIMMTIRVNEAQREAVKSQAEKKNLSQSWYLMELVEQDLKKDEDEKATLVEHVE